MTIPHPDGKRSTEDIEILSAKLHEIYMIEADRQEKELGRPIRHDWDYSKLGESTKEYDRVLARYILSRESAIQEKLRIAREALEKIPHPMASARLEPALIWYERVQNALKAIGGESE